MAYLITGIFYLVAGIFAFILIQRSLKNNYYDEKVIKSDDNLRKKIKSRIFWLTFSYIGIYFVGFIVAFIVSIEAGILMISIGIALAIYYTQSLESYKTITLIEKKLSNKIDNVNVTSVENLIAIEAAKQISDKVNVDEIKKQVLEELKKEIKKG